MATCNVCAFFVNGVCTDTAEFFDENGEAVCRFHPDAINNTQAARIQQLGSEVYIANELIEGQQSRIQQLEAELKSKEAVLGEIEKLMAGYSPGIIDGNAVYYYPHYLIEQIADKAREALNGK